MYTYIPLLWRDSIIRFTEEMSRSCRERAEIGSRIFDITENCRARMLIICHIFTTIIYSVTLYQVHRQLCFCLWFFAVFSLPFFYFIYAPSHIHVVGLCWQSYHMFYLSRSIWAHCCRCPTLPLTETRSRFSLVPWQRWWLTMSCSTLH